MNNKRILEAWPLARETLPQIKEALGSIHEQDDCPLNNVLEYVLDHGCQTIVREYPYQDAEYLDEYNNFHNSAFIDYGRDCERLHFFEDKIAVGSVYECFEENSALSYLGFMVLRPTEMAKVGRTVLRVPTKWGDNYCVTCASTFHSKIGSRELSVEGVPFIQSDRRVSVCAQAATWTALRSIHQTFNFPCHRPFEITENAIKYRGDSGRIFPAEGLNIGDLLNCLTNLNYSPLSWARQKKKEASKESLDEESDEKVFNFMSPYVESGIPVIAGLWSFGEKDGHAVTIVGHLLDSDWCVSENGEATAICTHNAFPGWIIQDDAKGPYRILARPEFKEDLKKTFGSLVSETYDTRNIIHAIVPLPPKVGLPGVTAAVLAENMIIKDQSTAGLLDKLLEEKHEGVGELANALFDKKSPLVLRTSLILSEKFKYSNSQGGRAASMSPKLIAEYRELDLPYFIWLVEISTKDRLLGEKENRKVLGEIIVDATAYPESPIACISVHLPGFLRCFDREELLLDEGKTIDNDKPYLLFRDAIDRRNFQEPRLTAIGIKTD